MHKISDELKFRPDRTTDYGVSCPRVLKKIPIDLQWGKWCLHASSLIFDRIIIKDAGYQDRHKSLHEFDFGPLVSMAHLYVLTLAHWTQVSYCCPLGYLFKSSYLDNYSSENIHV